MYASASSTEDNLQYFGVARLGAAPPNGRAGFHQLTNAGFNRNRFKKFHIALYVLLELLLRVVCGAPSILDVYVREAT